MSHAIFFTILSLILGACGPKAPPNSAAELKTEAASKAAIDTAIAKLDAALETSGPADSRSGPAPQVEILALANLVNSKAPKDAKTLYKAQDKLLSLMVNEYCFDAKYSINIVKKGNSYVKRINGGKFKSSKAAYDKARSAQKCTFLGKNSRYKWATGIYLYGEIQGVKERFAADKAFKHDFIKDFNALNIKIVNINKSLMEKASAKKKESQGNQRQQDAKYLQMVAIAMQADPLVPFYEKKLKPVADNLAGSSMFLKSNLSKLENINRDLVKVIKGYQTLPKAEQNKNTLSNLQGMRQKTQTIFIDTLLKNHQITKAISAHAFFKESSDAWKKEVLKKLNAGCQLKVGKLVVASDYHRALMAGKIIKACQSVTTDEWRSGVTSKLVANLKGAQKKFDTSIKDKTKKKDFDGARNLVSKIGPYLGESWTSKHTKKIDAAHNAYKKKQKKLQDKINRAAKRKQGGKDCKTSMRSCIDDCKINNLRAPLSKELCMKSCCDKCGIKWKSCF